MRGHVVLAVLLLAGSGSAARAVEPAGQPGAYGISPKNPVEVCRPDGARRYLEGLLCPTGERAVFTRLGSMDPRTPLPADMTQAEVVEMIQDSLQAKPLVPGEPDYHVLDGYEIECGGTGKTVLYLDAYHCSTPGPGQAPAGFRIAPQG